MKQKKIRLIEYFVDESGNKMAGMYEDENDSHIYTYYTKFKVKRTFPFNAENFEITIQGNGALADKTPASQGSFDYDIKTQGKDPYIQSVTVFDATDINIKDIADVSDLLKAEKSYFAYSSTYSHTSTSGIYEIPIDEDEDKGVYKTIGFYFEDKAGNSAIRTKRVYVDKEAPPDVFELLSKDTNNPILLKQSDEISFDYNKAKKNTENRFYKFI